MTSAYLGKICVNFLSVSFRKYNKNAMFSVENNYNKEKRSFLFESDTFCYAC